MKELKNKMLDLIESKYDLSDINVDRLKWLYKRKVELQESIMFNVLQNSIDADMNDFYEKEIKHIDEQIEMFEMYLFISGDLVLDMES